MIDLLLWGTALLLVGSTLWTLWRSRGMVTSSLLVPLAWLGTLAFPILLRSHMASTGFFLDGYHGAARNNLFIATSMANLTFVAFQLITGTRRFASLRTGLAAWVDGRIRPDGDGTALLRIWFGALLVVAVLLALYHWSLMPRIPGWDIVLGVSNSLQLERERENSAKLLSAPALLKYAFEWNSRLLLPVLLTTAVLQRWWKLAVVIGIFGLLYIMSPLEKFPAILLVIGPFVAIAIKDSRPVWSRLMIAGLVLSLVPALAIEQAPSLSVSVHRALHIPIATPPLPAVSTPPAQVPGGSGAGPAATNDPAGTAAPVQPPPAPALGFDASLVPVYVEDLLLRRIGALPADVSYAWFSYFPDAHTYLLGSGWSPWNVISGDYQSPSNQVAIWAFYGRNGYDLSSIRAYGPFTADGWAEFGYPGVLLACLGILALGIVLELMRALVRRPFCLALYAAAILLFALLPSQSGIMAIAFSSGLFLCPLICAAYLLSARITRPAPGRLVVAGQPTA